ncbi:cullin family protein [Skeletonema marinoi]|uniref:Cullin family protein n=1 Tax=Skeletonema marinoi TaxID=267567 RepID=A0AAD9DCB8_9STRA|nr:cullin family protein [Skeletonema marinoi]
MAKSKRSISQISTMSNSAQGNIIQLEDGWNNVIKTGAIDVLERTLDNGFDTSFEPKEYIRIYTTCYDMCTQRSPYNWSRDLYQRHGETIEQYLNNTVLPALRDKTGQGGTILLNELKHRWSNHQIMNKWLKKFFTYLDSLPTLEQAGLRHFKDEIYMNVKDNTTSSIISLIDEEREGEIIDKTLVKNIIELYEQMGMGSLDSYTNDLETPLLDATRSYYGRKREDWIARDSTPDYLIKAEKALGEEKDRVGSYLNSATEPKLRSVVEDEILQKVQMNLLEKEGSGCGKFITSQGNACTEKRQARLDSGQKDKNDDPDFVKSLIDLHEKYLGVIRETFSSHHLFQKALKNSFEVIVNNDDLKSGGEKLSETEVEQSLDRIVQLFSFLTDKDMFAEIYRNQLAKRLLNQRSASDDAEKAMIAS